MGTALFRQAAALLVTLVLVSLIILGIFALIPGDPALIAGGASASDEQVAALRETLGITGTMPERYAAWVRGALRGNLGMSTQYARPVNALIGERLGVTAVLALIASLITAGVSMPLGIHLARSPEKAGKTVLVNVLVLGLSVPNYISGILLVWLFGIVLHVFSPGGFVPFHSHPAGFFYALFWPALAVAIPNTCTLTKFVKDSVSRELEKDYVRTALSKGGVPSYVLYRHVLKNAACPVLTMSGIILADILSGSIVVEQVFSIPGIGRLLIGGINTRDFPVVISIVLYSTLVVVTVHSVSSLLIRYLDPRTGASL